jgi:hypothetical protein
VFSFQSEGREGHANEQQARQRAIRKVEEVAGKDEFVKEFDGYLSSLLQ